LKNIVLILFLFVFSASCVNKKPSPKLRFGTNLWPGYEPIYLAKTKFPRLEHLATLIEYPTSDEVMSDFAKGDLDVAFLTLDEALKLSLKVEDLLVFKIINFSNGADVLVSQKGINSLREIKGKTVGYEETTVGAFMLARALSFAGLRRDQVSMVGVPFKDHLEAFLTKKVDVLVTFEPYSSKLVGSGGKVIFESSQIPYEVIDLMVTRKSTLMKNKKQIQEILKRWDKTIESFLSDKGNSLYVMNQRLKMDKNDLLQVYDKLKFVQDRSNKELMGILNDTSRRVIEILKEIKRLPSNYQLPAGFFELQ
jgi:NitT/TauT family transport system substrate-binding protein